MNLAFKALILGCFLFSCSKYNKNIIVKSGPYQLDKNEFARKLYRKTKDIAPVKLKIKEVEVKNEIIYDFIKLSIIKKWAFQNNIFVKKEKLDQEIVKIMKNYSSEVQFFKSLSQHQFSYKEWKNELQDSLLEKKIFDLVTKKAPLISKKKLNEIYKNKLKKRGKKTYYKLAQIVLESRKNAQFIHNLILQKKDFFDLAKRYSIGKESSKKGIIGWLEKTKNHQGLFKEIFRLKKNQVSKAIKGPHSYHIFKVLDISKNKELFKPSKKSLEKELNAQRKSKFFKNWLDNEVKKIKVFLNKKLINSIKLEYKLEK